MHEVPQHTARPGVQRTVRLQFPLSLTITSIQISPALLAIQDQLDYNSGSIRYEHLRFVNLRAWAQVPSDNLNTTLVLKELYNDFSVRDSGTRGATRMAVALLPSLHIRQLQYTSVDDTAQFEVTVDPLPTGTDTLGVTIDVVVYFL